MTIGSSMSFDSAHARIRKKATRQLKQNNAEQLEQETKMMEDRIRTLKEQMVKEKEERERFGGTRWSTGKSGPLTTHIHQVMKKKPTKTDIKGPRKIRILSDEPLSSYVPKKTLLRESLHDTFTGGPQCGQCEKSKATLACAECTENYCVSCFMGFHKKGALKSHTTRNLDQYEHVLLEKKEKHSSSRVSRGDEKRARASRGRTSQNSNPPEQKAGGVLLQGTFNEEESSASFAQVLKEWRNSKGKDNTWVNPADAATAATVSCETSTGPEKLKPVDINLNFGTNKSMTYLDRLVLRKHRDDTNTPRPTSRDKGRRTAAGREVQSRASTSPSRADDDGFRINYREIFQSIGAHTARGKSPLNGYDRLGSAIKDMSSTFVIEEVSESIPSAEETTACIVEENNEKPDMSGPKRPSTRTGRVSIMGMTDTGYFREDAEDLDETSLISSRIYVTGLSSLSSVGAGLSTSRQKLLAQRVLSPSGSPRVWSPKPCYTGLSNFFLVGVESELPRESPNAVHRRTPSPSKRVSPKLLARGVWKPDESVCITDVSAQSGLNAENNMEDTSKYPDGGPVIPLVLEPSDDATTDAKPARTLTTKMSYQTSLAVGHMNDFGIVDFLKASPVPPKFSEDYCDVHRVSTVSPLSLTPNPPQIHWSDNESDDDVILEVTSRASMLELKQTEDSMKKDQDVDDQATLEDLSWELASTTGRLTQCEGDLDGCLDDEGGGSEDICDVDSIEGDGDRASLSSPDEHDFSLDSIDAVDEEEIRRESRMMEKEVQALE